MQKLLKCLYRDFETLNQAHLVFFTRGGAEVPGERPGPTPGKEEAPEAPEAPSETEKRLRKDYFSDQKLGGFLEADTPVDIKEEFKRQGKDIVGKTLVSMWDTVKKGELVVGLQNLSPDQLYKRISRDLDKKLGQLAEKLSGGERMVQLLEKQLGVSGEGTLIRPGAPREEEPVEPGLASAIEAVRMTPAEKARQEAERAVALLERQKGTKLDLQIVPNEGERDVHTLVQDHLSGIFFKLLDNPSAAEKLQDLFITSRAGTREEWDQMVRKQETGVFIEGREAAVYQYIFARYPELTKFDEYLQKEKRLMLCYSSQKDIFYLAGQKGAEPVVLAEASAADTEMLEHGRQRVAARIHKDEALGIQRGPIEIRHSYSKGFMIDEGGKVLFDGANINGLSLGEMKRRAETGKREVWQQAVQLGDQVLLIHNGQRETAVYNPIKKEYYYASNSKKKVEVVPGDQIAPYAIDKYNAGYSIAQDGTILFDTKQAELSIKLGDIKKANPSLPDQITLVRNGKPISGYFNQETGQYYTKTNTKNEKDRVRVFSGDRIAEYKPHDPLEGRAV